MKWDFKLFSVTLGKLITPGLLGNYQSFEVTELVRLPHKNEASQLPINVLTLIVADPREPNPEKVLLSEHPLPLKGTAWKFGLGRYRMSPAALEGALQEYDQSGRWQPGADPIAVGKLLPIAPQFVPADSSSEHPWNTVLKNNFWDGSHVLELFDSEKKALESLADTPVQQTALAALINPFVPLGVDLLPDRLGNVIIQVPVTSVVSGARGSADGQYILRKVWHPGITPRPLRVIAEIYNDGAIEAADTQVVAAGSAVLELHARNGGVRHTLWDIGANLILGASSETHFIRSISTAISIHDGTDVREFSRLDDNNETVVERVSITRPRKTSVIGEPVNDPRDRWGGRRVLRQRLSRLGESREFVQYGGPTTVTPAVGHQRALEDLRYLIKVHGGAGGVAMGSISFRERHPQHAVLFAPRRCRPSRINRGCDTAGRGG